MPADASSLPSALKASAGDIAGVFLDLEGRFAGLPRQKRDRSILAAPGQQAPVRPERHVEDTARSGAAGKRFSRGGVPDLDLVRRIAALIAAGAGREETRIAAEAHTVDRQCVTAIAGRFLAAGRVPAGDDAGIGPGAADQVLAVFGERHGNGGTDRGFVDGQHPLVEKHAGGGVHRLKLRPTVTERSCSSGPFACPPGAARAKAMASTSASVWAKVAYSGWRVRSQTLAIPSPGLMVAMR